MTDELSYSILEPGTKFIVSDEVKDSKYTPGTMGYVSYYHWGDAAPSANFVGMFCAVTRRGKKGMDRLEWGKIYVPVIKFDLKLMNFVHCGRIYEDLPWNQHYAHVDLMPMHNIDLLTSPALDFLGWTLAAARRLSYITQSSGDGLSAWHKLISAYSQIRNLTALDTSYQKKPKEVIKGYADLSARKTYLEIIRLSEARLAAIAVRSYHHRLNEESKVMNSLRKLSRNGDIKAKGIVKLAKARSQEMKDVNARLSFLNKKRKSSSKKGIIV